MNNGVAEYNVHTDPEAAHLVFKVLAKKLIVIPYEGVISVSDFTVFSSLNLDNQSFRIRYNNKRQICKRNL